VGFPIRKSPGQRPFAPLRSLSQLVASFVAGRCQGIPRVPLFTSNYTFSLRTSTSKGIAAIAVPPVPTPGAENGPAVFHSEKNCWSHRTRVRCSGEDACISQGIWFDLERTLSARWRENSSTKKRAGRRTNGVFTKNRAPIRVHPVASRGCGGCPDVNS